MRAGSIGYADRIRPAGRTFDTPDVDSESAGWRVSGGKRGLTKGSGGEEWLEKAKGKWKRREFRKERGEKVLG